VTFPGWKFSSTGNVLKMIVLIMQRCLYYMTHETSEKKIKQLLKELNVERALV